MTDVLLVAYLTALADGDTDTAAELADMAGDDDAVGALLADDDVAESYTEAEYRLLSEADRSHLVKRVITNKKGRKQTVYVRPTGKDAVKKKHPDIKARTDAFAAASALIDNGLKSRGDAKKLAGHLKTLTTEDIASLKRAHQLRTGGKLKQEKIDRIVADAKSRAKAVKAGSGKSASSPQEAYLSSPPERDPAKAVATAVAALPSLAPLAGSLVVRDSGSAAVRGHLSDLSLLPASLHERVAASGRTVHLGAVPAFELDDMGRHADTQLRGWADGSTWRTTRAAGCYNTEAKAVVAGHAGVSGGHGSYSLVLHEYAHGVDDMLSLTGTPELEAHHERLHPKLNSYEGQGGPGGRAGQSEMFAESVAYRMTRGRDAAVYRYDAEYVDWLDRTLGV